jgi:tagatose 6-phosphate kinase
VAPAHLATVTLNGTLDRVILVHDFATGTIRNAQDVITLPSGKGLNVARTALALGAEIMATGLLAGQCGRWIRSLLPGEGLSDNFVELPAGESRISTIIVDLSKRQTTVVNDLGPRVPAGLWPQIRRQLTDAVAEVEWVALAGAGLPGLPASVYADLCDDIQGLGQRVCLDARDQWLAHALQASPYLVKCNQHEAARLLGRAVNTPEHACDVAQAWVQAGIRLAVISLGQDGAVAVEAGGAWHVLAPKVDALYPIGSGDAMMAGLIVALDRGEPLPQAVQFGVALGAANTLVPGSGRCDLSALSELRRQATIQPA